MDLSNPVTLGVAAFLVLIAVVKAAGKLVGGVVLLGAAAAVTWYTGLWHNPTVMATVREALPWLTH